MTQQSHDHVLLLMICLMTHLWLVHLVTHSSDSCLPMIAQHAYWYLLSSLTDCSLSPLLICLLISFLITDPWLIRLLIASYHVYKLGCWVAYSPKPDLVTVLNQSSVFQHLPEGVLCTTKSSLPSLLYPRPLILKDRCTPFISPSSYDKADNSDIILEA